MNRKEVFPNLIEILEDIEYRAKAITSYEKSTKTCLNIRGWAHQLAGRLGDRAEDPDDKPVPSVLDALDELEALCSNIRQLKPKKLRKKLLGRLAPMTVLIEACWR